MRVSNPVMLWRFASNPMMWQSKTISNSVSWFYGHERKNFRNGNARKIYLSFIAIYNYVMDKWLGRSFTDVRKWVAWLKNSTTIDGYGV